MSEFELTAEPRTEQGTPAARRLRRSGKTPAILYGAGKDPVGLSLNQNELKKQLSHEAVFSHILTLKIGNKSEQVIIRDLQRNPGNAEVIHMDLLRIVATEAIQVRVPIHVINEDECPGKKLGGLITRHMAEVEVSCLPKDLPESIEVDVSGLEIGDAVHLSELKVASGVELVNLAAEDEEEQDQPVLSVQPPQREEVEEAAAAVALEEGAEAEEQPVEEAPEEPGAKEEGD